MILKHLIKCQVHPENRIVISLTNTLFCTLCHSQVSDYEVFRTDSDREP
jgi:hypothetical protein